MAMTEQVWAGAEPLREMLVPVDELTPHPDNPRRGVIEEIAKSLGRFGQVRAVLADGGTIIAGNHTYLAARSLGWTHVAAVLHNFSSPEEARAYLLADNRLGDLGEYEREELKQHLAALEATGRWDGTGYQQDDIDYMRRLDEAANAPPAPAPDLPAPSAPSELREVVLLFTDEQYTRFGDNVKVIRHEHGLEGVTEAVLRAVRDEALRVNQGAPVG